MQHYAVLCVSCRPSGWASTRSDLREGSPMASHFLFRTQFVAKSHSTTVTLGLRSHRSRTQRPRESIFYSVPFWGQQQAGNVADASRDGATDFSDPKGRSGVWFMGLTS